MTTRVTLCIPVCFKNATRQRPNWNQRPCCSNRWPTARKAPPDGNQHQRAQRPQRTARVALCIPVCLRMRRAKVPVCSSGIIAQVDGPRPAKRTVPKGSTNERNGHNGRRVSRYVSLFVLRMRRANVPVSIRSQYSPIDGPRPAKRQTVVTGSTNERNGHNVGACRVMYPCLFQTFLFLITFRPFVLFYWAALHRYNFCQAAGAKARIFCGKIFLRMRRADVPVRIAGRIVKVDGPRTALHSVTAVTTNERNGQTAERRRRAVARFNPFFHFILFLSWFTFGSLVW